MRSQNLVFLCLFMTQVAFANRPIVINLNVSQTSFQVALPANPTTGYQWTLESYDRSLLNLTSSKYFRPESNALGAGGTMVFSFELVDGINPPPMTSLVFNYLRSWEEKPVSIQTVTVNFSDQSLPTD